MYYTIYKTTNRLNGKFYVGMHKTEKYNDNYLGSGKIFEIAVKKYGRECFVKEVLVLCESYDEMVDLEKALITKDWLIKNKGKTYNMSIGGEGGCVWNSPPLLGVKGKDHPNFGKTGSKNSMFGRKHTQEAKKAISDKNRGKKRASISEETRLKRSLALKGKKAWNKGLKGFITPEMRMKINEGKKRKCA